MLSMQISAIGHLRFFAVLFYKCLFQVSFETLNEIYNEQNTRTINEVQLKNELRKPNFQPDDIGTEHCGRHSRR